MLDIIYSITLREYHLNTIEKEVIYIEILKRKNGNKFNETNQTSSQRLESKVAKQVLNAVSDASNAN